MKHALSYVIAGLFISLCYAMVTHAMIQIVQPISFTRQNQLDKELISLVKRTDMEPEDQIEEIKLLVECGANVNARSQSGMTPLLLAAGLGNCAVVTKLIELGATVPIMDNDGNTALHYAVSRGHLSTLNLIAGLRDPATNMLYFDVNTCNRRNETPLMLASYAGHFLVVARLIELGASVPLTGAYDQTSLHCALRQNKMECADVLIKAGSPIDVADQTGATALSLARAYDVAHSADLAHDSLEMRLITLRNQFLYPTRLLRWARGLRADKLAGMRRLRVDTLRSSLISRIVRTTTTHTQPSHTSARPLRRSRSYSDLARARQTMPIAAIGIENPAVQRLDIPTQIILGS